MIKKILILFLMLVCDVSNARVLELVSNCGIKFWYHKDDSTPLIHLAVAFKNAGSAFMPLSKRGVPALYKDIVFKGCGNYDREKFERKVNDISVRLGVYTNNDNLFFLFTFPKIVQDEAISLFKMVLLKPSFKPQEIERAKGVLYETIDNYQYSPISWAESIAMPKILFGDHCYGDDFGSAEDMLKLTSDDLKKYQKQYIVKANLEVCLFGDVSEKEAKEMVDKIFDSFPKGKKSEDKITDVEPNLTNKKDNYYLEGSQSFIVFAMRNILTNCKEKHASTVLYHILGSPGTCKNRIIEHMRGKKGLIYSGAVQKVELNHACFGRGWLQTSNEKVSEAVNSIKELIADLRKNGITESELNSAKSSINGSFVVSLRNTSALSAFYIVHKVRGSSPEILEEKLKAIDDVDLDQVNRVSSKILDENKIPFVIIGGNKSL